VLSSNEFVNKSPAYPNITLSKYHGGLHVLIHLIHLGFFRMQRGGKDTKNCIRRQNPGPRQRKRMQSRKSKKATS